MRPPKRHRNTVVADAQTPSASQTGSPQSKPTARKRPRKAHDAAAAPSLAAVDEAARASKRRRLASASTQAAADGSHTAATAAEQLEDLSDLPDLLHCQDQPNEFDLQDLGYQADGDIADQLLGSISDQLCSEEPADSPLVVKRRPRRAAATAAAAAAATAAAAGCGDDSDGDNDDKQQADCTAW